jgi:SpoVK/Ycf46/Vps4 family AAA+-type ATPase
MAILKEMKVRGSTEVDEAATWDNLALDEKTLKFLKETSERLKFAEAFAKQGITPPRGILLYGPPGTGKTQVARTLAHETCLRFIGATTADLKANYLGQSGSKVRELFERARANAPAIIFIDEIDIIAPVRGTYDDPMTQEIVGQLLQETDGIKRQQASVFIVAATNYPKMVDAAVLDRIPVRIEIPLPDLASRRKLLEIHLRSKPIGFSLDKLQQLAEAGDGKSGRAIRDWVEAATQGAVSRAIREGTPEKVLIKIEDFGFQESAATG